MAKQNKWIFVLNESMGESVGTVLSDSFQSINIFLKYIKQESNDRKPTIV